MPTTVSSNNYLNNKSNRNTCLSFFEILASMFIVLIHIRFPSTMGDIVEGLARFAVPLFFTISGFYLIKKDMTVKELRSKLLKRIYHITRITLFSFILYFFLLGGQALASGTFATWFVQTFNLRAWIELILFNNPLLMVTNWFLVALLFCYFIIYLFPTTFLNNKKVNKIIVYFLPVWVIVRLIMMATKIKIGGYLLADATYYRSWYAVGLPFVCYGILLKENEDKLKAVSIKIIILGLIVSCLEMTIANYLFIHLLGDSIAYYCGSVFVVFFIICLTVQKPTLFSNNPLINIKGNWTMLLYVFHPAVIGIIQLIINSLGINQLTFVLWIEPILALALSMLLAIIVNRFIIKK